MDTNTEASLTKHLRTWLDHIRACEASGQKMKTYASQQGLSLRSMYDAKKALVKKGVLPRSRSCRQNRFQQVRIAPAVKQPVSSDWSIRLPNAVVVNFTGSFDTSTLEKVLKTAGSVQ
jgi:hypothetical protein